MALVRDLNRREGKTVAMVIHDLDLALRYSDYLVVMQKGRVAAQGPTDEVLASGAVGDAFQMDICPHDRPHPSVPGEGVGTISYTESNAGAEAVREAERGYVLYPRSR